jgi:hypothetical protein
MHSNLTKALADEKIADLLREANHGRRARVARVGAAQKPPRRRRFAPRLRRPAVA